MIKHKTILQRFFLLSFGLIIGLVITEIAAHKYLETNKLVEKLNYAEGRAIKFPKIYMFDRDLGWSGRPNSQSWHTTSEYEILYSINSKGIRDKEIPLEKPFGEFRILALGESTVFGHGVNYGERFTEIIEDCLTNVDVINMGVSGFGIDQSLLQLQRDGFQFKPNIVILFVAEDSLERCKTSAMVNRSKPRFALNDKKNDIVLLNTEPIRNKVAVNSPQIQQTPHRQNKKKDNVFLAKSSLYALLDYNIRIKEARKRIEEADKALWQTTLDKIYNQRREISTYDDNDFRSLIFLILKKCRDLSNIHAANFLIVYIGLDETYFMNYLKNPCDDLGISYFDLPGVLYQAAGLKSLRFTIDPHYNAFTHKVIGEYVSDYIAKKYNLQKNKDYAYEFLGKFKFKN